MYYDYGVIFGYSLTMTIMAMAMIGMILCPLIACAKGRSIVGWFFGGLFLGGIGLLIIIFLPKKKNFFKFGKALKKRKCRFGKIKVIFKL